MSDWLTLKEAGNLTSSMIGMEPEYWMRFFSNTSRGVRAQRGSIENWMRVETKLKDGLVRIKEDSLVAFLGEATKRKFPLHRSPKPYKKKKTTMKPENQKITEVQQAGFTQPVIAGGFANPQQNLEGAGAGQTYSRPSARAEMVDGEPRVTIEIAGLQRRLSMQEATTLVESLKFAVEATALWLAQQVN